MLKAAAFFPQIGRHYFANVRWDVVASNLLTGYFLKMVVADNLHNYTSWISYPYYQVNGTLTNSVLIVGYACQIFSDFAGYSMIAIGLAEGFGYKLMTNFNFPYISRSLSEFWRRWHISLSSWLRNYLYIPLGGNQRGHVRTYFNLLIVMALGGLWHGAAWSYAVWGVFHGVGLVVERLATQVSKRFIPNRPALGTIPRFLLSAVQMGTVFVFVMIGWCFSYCPTLLKQRPFSSISWQEETLALIGWSFFPSSCSRCLSPAIISVISSWSAADGSLLNGEDGAMAPSTGLCYLRFC